MSSTYDERECPVCGFPGAHHELNCGTGEQEILCPRCGFTFLSEIREHQGVQFWRTTEYRPISKSGYVADVTAKADEDETLLHRWNAKEFGTLASFKSDEQIAREVFGAQDAAAYEALTEPKPVTPLNPHFFPDDEI